MTSDILEKYANRRLADLADPASDRDAAEDCGAFGWLRGLRERAAMLELRKRNGNIVAIGYGWLERAEFDPSDGITLHVLGKRIRIQGRNLNAEVRPSVRLFEGIVRHRVPWAREASQADAIDAGAATTLVEDITV